jgi:hypothetical protein
MPSSDHPTYLTRSAERALAGRMIEAVTGSAEGPMIADMLDVTSAAILAAAGVVDLAEQRAVCAALWGHPVTGGDRVTP